MSNSSDDDLVVFLLQETGDDLDFVLEYTADSWESRYLSGGAQEVATSPGTDVDELLDIFRAEGPRMGRLSDRLELGHYYCTLHLFGGVVLLHFCEPGRHGIVFGYDPAAASHLTEFVAVVLPHIRDAGLAEIETEAAWDSSDSTPP